MTEQAYKAMAREFVGGMMKHLRARDAAMICDETDLPMLMRANIVRIRFSIDARNEVGSNVFFQMDFSLDTLPCDAYARVVRQRIRGEIEAIRSMTAVKK